MATAKEKRIRERLEQIKARAAEMAANEKDNKAAANLAEEAASLGLEALEGGK